MHTTVMEFDGQLRLLSTAEGGRHGPIAALVYRPRLRLGDVGWEGRVEELEQELLKPGEEGRCKLSLILLQDNARLIQPGTTLELLEGSKIVGTCTIRSAGRAWAPTA